MIELRKVEKSFGKQVVLENIDLTIPDGAIFGLIGINGAGKSTLLRLLSGVLRADAGEILIDGESVFENPRRKRDLFFLSDDPFYTVNVTGEKLRALYSVFYSFDNEMFLRMTEHYKLDLKKPLRTFSKGMQRRMFISLALAVKPKYLFLDEAFDGLDPLARLEFKQNLVDLSEETGCTVILSGHSLRELEDICDRFGLLNERKLMSSGEIDKELEQLHKFQIAFTQEVSEDKFPFRCLSYHAVGRVVKLVARGEREELLSAIEALSPVLVDELPMDFEEFFLCEVENGGC